MTRVEKGSGWELRLGKWQDVLADVQRVDSVITDPPYSARTHAGQLAGDDSNDGQERAELEYTHITPEDVFAIISAWATRISSWICAHTDSDLIVPYRYAADANGLTSFHPLPCVVRGMTVRMNGDGPSSWATYLMVARTKAAHKWGTLPGAYTGPQGERLIAGSKSESMMRQIVRDYSRPGDLVCDPYAGSGTTLLAAVMEGRRAIGAEMSEERFELAVKRLRAGYTTDLFGGA